MKSKKNPEGLNQKSRIRNFRLSDCQESAKKKQLVGGEGRLKPVTEQRRGPRTLSPQYTHQQRVMNTGTRPYLQPEIARIISADSNHLARIMSRSLAQYGLGCNDCCSASSKVTGHFSSM